MTIKCANSCGLSLLDYVKLAWENMLWEIERFPLAHDGILEGFDKQRRAHSTVCVRGELRVVWYYHLC